MKRFAAWVMAIIMVSALALPVLAKQPYELDYSGNKAKYDSIFTRIANLIKPSLPPEYQYVLWWNSDRPIGDAVIFSKTPVINIGDEIYVASAFTNGMYDIYPGTEKTGKYTVRYMRNDPAKTQYYQIGQSAHGDIVNGLGQFVGDRSTAMFADIQFGITGCKLLYLDGIPDVDTSALEALIAQAEALISSEYTAETWGPVASALGDAKSLLAGVGYTQAQVDAKAVALQNALSGLVLVPTLPDTTELRKVLAEAKAIEDTGYTSFSWSRLQTAIVQGDELLMKPLYTKNEVDMATTNLRTGINGLEIYTVPPEPGNHRYLVDGIRLVDLFPAQDAIMQNIREGRKFGMFVFAVLLAIVVVIRLVKKLLNIDYSHDSKRDDTMLR